MLLIVCPYCGKRPELEFTHGGQAHLVRPAQPGRLDDQTWTDFLYMRANTRGIYAERWRHAHGCGRFFNALRDTTTDHFIATYKAGQPQPTLPGTSPETRAGTVVGAAADSCAAVGVGSATEPASAARPGLVGGSGAES